MFRLLLMSLKLKKLHSVACSLLICVVCWAIVRGSCPRNNMLVRSLKHHHWLLILVLAAWKSATTGLMRFLRDWSVRVNSSLVHEQLLLSTFISAINVFVSGNGRLCSVIALRLSTSLLLIVELLRNLTLILPGNLLEKLKTCREMLNKSMLYLVGLSLLSDLEKSFLQVPNWARSIRLLVHLSFGIWAVGDWLGSLMRIDSCWQNTTNYGVLIGFLSILWLWLMLIFAVVIQILPWWLFLEGVGARTWDSSWWGGRRTLNIFHRFLRWTE